MARPVRFQYAGAVYHVMARGDGGKRIFIGKEDHDSFLVRLERVCGSHGWRVHAWVLMGNHFHLLLETPEPNLSEGMRVLLGSFSQAWNLRHQRRGHVFQGRYKAVPVAGERAGDAYYFKATADYIHLNPARAGVAGGRHGKLADYPWSSLQYYAKGKPPPWLPRERVLDAFQLARDGRGTAAYVAWLEARAAAHKGKIDETAMAALRRGWYLGEESFKDKLLGMMTELRAKARKKGSHTGQAVKAHNMAEADRIITALSKPLGLPLGRPELMLMKKGARAKVICAAIVKAHTAVGNDWLAERLAMGQGAYVSSLVNQLRRVPGEWKALSKYDKIWKYKD